MSRFSPRSVAIVGWSGWAIAFLGFGVLCLGPNRVWAQSDGEVVEDVENGAAADDPANPASAVDNQPQDAGAPPATNNKTKPRRRLPLHFGAVVNPDQRQAIFQIEDEMAPRIQQLEQELAKLKQEREERFLSVLDGEQRGRLTALVAATTAKRKAAAEARKAKWDAFLKWLAQQPQEDAKVNGDGNAEPAETEPAAVP